MALSAEDIIEAVVDPLAMGDLGERHDAFRFERLQPGTRLLDYGEDGRFRLDVVQID